ncbi:uncharacterized protein LOC113135884 [Mastacembelus armatus]|uniref:Lipopolysaccharide induced TNF factor n=1 Tax=Mastacembelus armatus TaxID=205130 RepID=A0A3Q3KZ41_9TELE|nr:lipopolysaccharide-induced tumor necrosis factor-alpha factor [Mastacembelus armatus]
MESRDHDMELLESFNDTCVSPEREQEQQDKSELDTQTESNQETPELQSSPPTLTAINFRIQQLHNRRFLLQKREHFKKKAEDQGGGSPEELASPVSDEDSDELCELEAIQKELDKLLAKKEELEKQGKSSSGQQDACIASYKMETPHGGIYMLPPFELSQGDSPAEMPLGPIIPVESLGHTSAVTRCPYCERLIATETCSTVSEEMWLVCCLCTMVGCVAGCCFIPFFVDRLRKVNHHCPQCQANIHTLRPF